jgi:hypothetical protein
MRDLRKYSQDTNFRIIIGSLFLIFILGDGLIYYFYGSGSALMGLVCLLLGFVPVFLIILSIVIMDSIVKRANKD